MHKRLVLVAALFLSTLPSFVHSQPNYTLPRRVNLDPIVRRTFGGFWERAYPGGPMRGLMTEQFFPIGWSRDGKFAYYTEPVDEECGCYFAELHIIDLKTDKVLYEFENKPQDRMDDKGIPIPDDMEKLWARNREVFIEKLQDHGIIPQSRFALLSPTFTIGGKVYAAKVTAPKFNDPDGMRRTRSVKLDLSTPTLGKKTLYTASYKGDDVYVSPLDSGVAGAFKSPYEDRAVIVMINVQRGWEGPPHTVDVRLAGADLKTGFKRR